VILGEALVAIGIVDSLRRVTVVAASQITGAAVVGKAGGFVDEDSGLGIGAGVGRIPEGTAQIDLSERVGICPRNLSASEQRSCDRKIYAQTYA